jgi:hypothetical protein
MPHWHSGRGILYRMADVFREYADDARAITEAAPSRAVSLAVEVCEGAPDDEHLLAIAVVILDPLLDQRWDLVGAEFESAMRESAALRRAWSGAMPDIPQDAIDRLDGLLAPGEDIGRQA